MCSCRRQGVRPGGRSTFGTCDSLLSWIIDRGRADDHNLAALEVVMTGRYDDDPSSPWLVPLYIDESADPDQQSAFADMALGRAGATTLANFAKAIDEVYAMRQVKIRLDHRQSVAFRVSSWQFPAYSVFHSRSPQSHGP